MSDLNEPAFPSSFEGYTTAPEYYMGMSLRDYFAAKALPSVILSSWPDLDFKPMNGLTPCENTARFAYEMADAMLKVRKENQ